MEKNMKETLAKEELLRKMVTIHLITHANKYLIKYKAPFKVTPDNVDKLFVIDKLLKHTKEHLDNKNDSLTKTQYDIFNKNSTDILIAFNEAIIGLGLFSSTGAILTEEILRPLIAHKFKDALSIILSNSMNSLKFIGSATIYFITAANILGYAYSKMKSREIDLKTAYDVIDNEISTFVDLKIKKDIKKKYKKEAKFDYEDIECPITHTILVDPVTAPDGRSYERKALQKWYDSGHRTCPMNPSKALIDPSTLQTNYTLEMICDAYRHEYNAKFVWNPEEKANFRADFDNNNNNNSVIREID
jgi:hypothetical protein